MNTNNTFSFVSVTYVGILSILATIFCVTLVSLLFPRPVYSPLPPVFIEEQSLCEDSGGFWHEGFTPEDQGYCDTEYSIRVAFEEREARHKYLVFLTLSLLGIVLLVLGMVLKKLPTLFSSALLWTGGIVFLVATLGYWSDAHIWTRFAIVCIGLIFVIYGGYKKIQQ